MFNKGIQIETAQKQIGKVSVDSASLLAENHIKARADGAFGLRSGNFSLRQHPEMHREETFNQ